MPNISDIIRINTSVSSRGVLARDLGRTLFLYDAVDVNNLTFDASTKNIDNLVARQRDLRVSAFADLQAVEDAYIETDDAVKAASVYFAQRPRPRNFLTAGRFNGGAKTYVYSTESVSTPHGSLTGTLRFGTQVVNVSGNPGTLANALTAIANAINQDTPATGVTVRAATGAPDRFVLTIPAAFADLLNAPMTGDLAEKLHWNTEAATFIGTPAESYSNALDRIAAKDDSWYWLTVAASIASDRVQASNIATWASDKHVMFVVDTTNDAAALITNEDVSNTAQLAKLGYDRTTAIWSAQNDYKSLALAARFSSVDFDRANSLITAKFKTLPGTTADHLTLAQTRELDRKRVNYYTPFGGTAIVAEGVTLDTNTWIDVRYWLDWLVTELQTELFNYQLRAVRIPQTDSGITSILATIDRTLEKGVTNGGIAPGYLSENVVANVKQITRNSDFDGYLATGYLTYIKPLIEQSQADRISRKLPPINVWCKGSGAIHGIDISINFED